MFIMKEDKNLKEFETLEIEPLIAEKPLKERELARLIVINRKEKTINHMIFKDIINYFEEGDCLVLNQTKVIKSKIYYTTVDGKRKDLLFLQKKDENGKIWEVIGKKLKTDKKYILDGGAVIEKIEKTINGSYIIYLNIPVELNYLSTYGKVPLPSYIIKKRKEKNLNEEFDDDFLDYQTVYAKEEGSIAAPTAGFHFTEELLKRIEEKGVKIARLTLHIGWGTFKMVREDPDLFKMPQEYAIIPKETARIINETKENKKKVFIVGTSSMRSVESMCDENGKVYPGEKFCDIFIKPGYKFKVADCFITNLHVPNSPPLYMTAAFAGKDLLLEAYKQAIKEGYRFYSYGDASLIL